MSLTALVVAAGTGFALVFSAYLMKRRADAYSALWNRAADSLSVAEWKRVQSVLSHSELTYVTTSLSNFRVTRSKGDVPTLRDLIVQFHLQTKR